MNGPEEELSSRVITSRILSRKLISLNAEEVETGLSPPVLHPRVYELSLKLKNKRVMLINICNVNHEDCGQIS